MRSSRNDLGLSSLWFKSVSYLVKLAVEYLRFVRKRKWIYAGGRILCGERSFQHVTIEEPAQGLGPPRIESLKALLRGCL